MPALARSEHGYHDTETQDGRQGGKSQERKVLDGAEDGSAREPAFCAPRGIDGGAPEVGGVRSLSALNPDFVRRAT
jgi:hypothetical protein